MTARCYDPAHGSYSADSDFDTCTFLAHAVRDLGLKKSFGAKAIVGSVVDGALSAELMGAPWSLEDLFTQRLKEEPTARVYSMDEMATKAEALIRLGIDEVLPTYPKVHGTQVEVHWEIDGEERHAHLDVVFDDATIVDWKTSEQRLGENRAHKEVQLSEYATAVWMEYGVLPPRVGLHGFIYANPPKDVLLWRPTATKPWFDEQWSVRTREQVESHLEAIRCRQAAREWMTTTGVWLTQGRSHPYACNDCPAKHLCPAWVGFETGKEITSAA